MIRSSPPPPSTVSLPGPASTKSLEPSATSVSSPPSPYSWSGLGVPWMRSEASVPTNVSASAVVAATTGAALATTRMHRTRFICLINNLRASWLRRHQASLRVLVARLAGHEDARGAVAHRDFRQHRLDSALARRGQRGLDGVELGQQ